MQPSLHPDKRSLVIYHSINTSYRITKKKKKKGSWYSFIELHGNLLTRNLGSQSGINTVTSYLEPGGKKVPTRLGKKSLSGFPSWGRGGPAATHK